MVLVICNENVRLSVCSQVTKWCYDTSAVYKTIHVQQSLKIFSSLFLLNICFYFIFCQYTSANQSVLMNCKQRNGQLKNTLFFFCMVRVVSLHRYIYFICSECLYVFGHMVLCYFMLIAPKTSRHFTYNVTLWHVCITIVAMQMQRCFPFVGLTYVSLSTL